MQANREDDIRTRAYEIWERDGRPDGHAEEHWRRAEHELQAGESGAEQAEASNPGIGAATGLQRGGTEPAGGQSVVGSIGTGGGSTMGEPTGSRRGR